MAAAGWRTTDRALTHDLDRTMNPRRVQRESPQSSIECSPASSTSKRSRTCRRKNPGIAPSTRRDPWWSSSGGTGGRADDLRRGHASIAASWSRRERSWWLKSRAGGRPKNDTTDSRDDTAPRATPREDVLAVWLRRMESPPRAVDAGRPPRRPAPRAVLDEDEGAAPVGEPYACRRPRNARYARRSAIKPVSPT